MRLRVQCLSRLIGRLSAISTRSPILASLRSSWALKCLVRRTVLPYRRCLRSDSTATTTVFCILLLITVPVSVRLLGRSAVAIALSLHCLQLELALARHYPSDVAPHLAQSRGIGELPRGGLEAQVELLLAQLAHAVLELLGAQSLQFVVLHASASA